VTRRIIVSEILLVHLEALCDSHQESRKAVKFHVQMRHASLSEGVREEGQLVLAEAGESAGRSCGATLGYHLDF
jgi:hypothetical protein